jgi:hypothetical protein
MSSSVMSEKRRESFGTSLTQKFKAPETGEHHKSVNHTQGPQAQSKGENEVGSDTAKLSHFKEMPTKFPKMHFGPFNAQCLLMEAPRTILLKIE